MSACRAEGDSGGDHTILYAPTIITYDASHVFPTDDTSIVKDDILHFCIGTGKAENAQVKSVACIIANTAYGLIITIEVTIKAMTNAVYNIAYCCEVVIIATVCVAVSDISTQLEVFIAVVIACIDAGGQQVQLVRVIDDVWVILAVARRKVSPIGGNDATVDDDISIEAVIDGGHGKRVGVRVACGAGGRGRSFKSVGIAAFAALVGICHSIA